MEATVAVRLSGEEIDTLKTTVAALDPDAQVWLFGSRCDLSKRGGDIDIIILSDKITLAMLRSVRIAFFKKFGEQKIDLVLDKSHIEKVFVRKVIKSAVKL